MKAPDVSKLSAEERYALARQMAEEMRASLPQDLHPSRFTLNSKLPFKACSFREALIHRESDLADTALSLYESNRLIPALVITRALVETTALLYGLHVKTSEFLEKKDEGAFNEFLVKGMFGSKDGTTQHQSFNILTAVDRMDKEFGGLRQMYDTLCEFTHPNFSGVMGSYSKVEKEKHLVLLGRDNHQPPLAFGLGPLIGCLAVFTEHYNALADLLKQVSDLYEQGPAV